MQTVGQILKNERERKFYTLLEIEKATKIRIEFLEALEEGNYIKLPPPTFVQGFIKSYGKFLRLDINKLLAIFRREFSDQKYPPRILESFQNPLEQSKFRLTPTKVIGVMVLAMVLIFFAYLWFEYRFLVEAPFLEISSPFDQETFDVASVQISGRTDPEAKVSINNQEIQVDISGKFYQEVALTEGSNTVMVTATSRGGRVSKVEKTVFLRSNISK